MTDRTLTLPVERLGARVIVGLPDFVDAVVRDQAREQLLDAIEPGMDVLVLDMSDATFIDSAGLGVLMAAHRRAQHLGCRVSVVTSHPVVRHMITLAGADQVLAMRESLHDALAIGLATAPRAR